MIVVDTSALIAIVLEEPASEACIGALAGEDDVRISAGTLAEVLVVAAGRNVQVEVRKVLARFNVQVVALTEQSALAVGDAYARWGKGLHPAGLNFGDCFAYALANEYGCALLFVGRDFAQTDVPGAL